MSKESRSTRKTLRSVGATIGATAMLVIGIDYVTFAATGDSLMLGRGNSASTLTSIVRSTDGGVLSLKAQPGSPALNVNTKNRIANLNADTVDGIHGPALARKSNLTTFQAPSCQNLETVDATFAKMADLGTFQKQFVGSSLDIDFTTNLTVGSGDALGVIFELRVDNTVLAAVNVRSRNHSEIVHLSGYAQGIGSGTHTVSLWVRGAGASPTAEDARYDSSCFGASSPAINRVNVLEFY